MSLRLADLQFNGQEVWRPINDAQLAALHSKAQMLLYGGGSGGGKTDLLVADACQEFDNSNLRALLIRRSFTEMNNILDRTHDIYSQMGATWRGEDHTWRFPAGYPNGARVQLGYMKEDGNVTQYQGNPRSWIGVDESTFLREKAVRDLLPWLAPTDPSLFPRVRLATNPGEIGADWHTHVFLRGKCPMHHPDESVKPGVVYRGSKWTDGVPVGLTVAFIPSLAADNPLYGQQKLDLLASQTADRKERLLLGCWCALSGRYFAFLTPEYKRPLAEAGAQWWYTHLISIDYGFGGSNGEGSWAAAGLYCVTEPSPAYPEGQMFKLGEMVEPETGSKDFARQICEAFVLPTFDGQRRRITAAYFDPANDAHTGTGKSNMDLMAEVFEEYGIPAVKAAKDRIGNAQNLYNMLKYRQVVITDSCPKTFTALNTRMHDPKHPGDIKKVKGDPLDDLYDETAYVTNTYFEQTIKPTEIAFQEKLQQARQHGASEHTLWILQQQQLLKTQSVEAPVYLGRRHRH